jgi:superfamily II DNA or RNA helicase
MNENILVRDSGIRVPYSFYQQNKSCLEPIITRLRRKVEDYSTKEKIEMKFYIANNKKQEILLPRFCELPFHITFDDQRVIGSDIEIESNIIPRNEKQVEAINFLSNNDKGILCLNPGTGKTVIAIEMICKYKKKTIILLHKDSLAQQWVERIVQFTNLKEDDIGRLKTASYEKDLNHPIIISTVQTVCSMYDKYDDLTKIFKDANIGIMIADEVHAIIGPEQFSLASLHIPAKRTFGLSATPYRIANKDIMLLHMGQIYIPLEKVQDTMIPKITVLKFDHGVMSNPKTTKYIRWNSKTNEPSDEEFSKERYLQQLSKSQKFNNIINEVVKKVEKSPRRLLFLSDRINILDNAAKAVDNKDYVGFFLPRSGKNRDAAKFKKLIFSTYGSARDGFDEPELSCLIMSTPTANIEQCVGRVVRTHPGKPEPVIIDLVDISCNEMISRYEYRKKFYDSKNWKVEEKEVK